MALIPTYYERLRRERDWTIRYERTQERQSQRTLSGSDTHAMAAAMGVSHSRKRRIRSQNATFGRVLSQARYDALPVLPAKKPNAPRQLLGDLGNDPEMEPIEYEQQPGAMADIIRSLSRSMAWRCRHAVFEASSNYPRDGTDNPREIENELWIKVLESGLSTDTHSIPYIFVALRNRLEDAIRVGRERQKAKRDMFRRPDEPERKPDSRPNNLYRSDYAAKVEAEPMRVFHAAAPRRPHVELEGREIEYIMELLSRRAAGEKTSKTFSDKCVSPR